MPSGSLTTDGTEQNIFNDEPGSIAIIEGSVDLSNMTSSEDVTLRLYKEIGSSYTLLNQWDFSGAQTESAKEFGPIMGSGSFSPLKLTVEETTGNGITVNYEWQREVQQEAILA